MENLELKEKRKLTGVIYHQDMLEHRIHKNLLKSADHVENPYRLIKIMDKLQKSGELEDCVVLNDFDEISWEDIEYAHGKDYCNYLK